MEISLKLPNQVGVIQPSVDFVYSWGLEHGLSEKEASELATAFDELITDVVLFAFGDNEGEFSVMLKDTLSQLEITVHELGEPFDPNRHKYSVEKVLSEGNFDGSGFEVIKNLVDHFIYIYKGKAGKEYRIIKEIKHPHITQLFTQEELAVEPEKAVSYQIAPVSEEDAEDIARLIYRAYGYTYPKEDMYYPDRIVKALKEGKKFGVIVRTDRGEAVGYFAVIMSTDSNIGEVGEVVVSPKHRGKGIMKMMMKALIDMAKARGLEGLFGEAVTVHTISQRVNAKFGFKSTALVLGFFPYIEYKGFEHKQQRISVVIDFLPLKERKVVSAYLPEDYRKILKEIYANMGIELKNIPVRKELKLAEKSNISLQINYRFETAVVVVRDYGEDFESRIDKNIQALEEKGMKGIYIDLPLDEAFTKKAVPILKKKGFVFSGLMPLFHQERDFLRMQKIYEDLDFDGINVFSDMAVKIKKLIQKEMGK
ncbi:MAG: GNAT family N-acetyltransferase [Aquificae bacterium]|nr:GNAT family N-acetyltransferase [Aquificota bacterium]